MQDTHDNRKQLSAVLLELDATQHRRRSNEIEQLFWLVFFFFSFRTFIDVEFDFLNEFIELSTPFEQRTHTNSQRIYQLLEANQCVCIFATDIVHVILCLPT